MVVAAAFYSCVSRQEIIDVDNQNTRHRGRTGRGASSLAMAQQAGTPAGNAGMSGGPGTHQGAEKTGSASNKQKVEKNQNGYQGGHQ